MERRSCCLPGRPSLVDGALEIIVGQDVTRNGSVASFWRGVGTCKRFVASKQFYEHDFPAPQFDSVESVVDCDVPPEYTSAHAEFDGSVVVERTAGEASASCHDEAANSLALNLMNDIVTGELTVDAARQCNAKEFLDYRRKKPTLYMDALPFEPGEGTADPVGLPVLLDEEPGCHTRLFPATRR